jgi:hypothetical protein
MTRRREGPGSPLLVGMRPLNEDNRFKVLLAFIPDRIGVERRRLLPDGIKAIDGAAGAEGAAQQIKRAERYPNLVAYLAAEDSGEE